VSWWAVQMATTSTPGTERHAGRCAVTPQLALMMPTLMSPMGDVLLVLLVGFGDQLAAHGLTRRRDGDELSRLDLDVEPARVGPRFADPVEADVGGSGQQAGTVERAHGVEPAQERLAGRVLPRHHEPLDGELGGDVTLAAVEPRHAVVAGVPGQVGLERLG